MNRIVFQCVLWVAALLLPIVSHAQQNQEVVDLGKLDSGSTWIGMVIALVLALCIGVGSFMSPRRSHQD